MRPYNHRFDEWGLEMEKEDIRTAVREALAEIIAPDETPDDFWIARKEHYSDHKFIHDLRCWTDDIKSTAIRTLVKTLITAAIAGALTLFAFRYHGG